MPICHLCSQEIYPAGLSSLGICGDCHKKHALSPRTEPLRPRIPCARCGHSTFVRCHVIRERGTTAGEYGQEYIAPLSATFAHQVSRTFWAGRSVASPDTEQPVGVFEAYICRTCGFTELYARDARSIPIGDEYGTELFETSSGTPYR